MRWYKILSLILVAVLATSVGLISCSPQPTGGTGGGGGGGTGGTVEKITIIFNFGGTYLPEDYSVVPFVVGGLDSINSNNYYNWENVTNGGIKQDGTGTHVLSKIDAANWKLEIPVNDILADPDTPFEVQFKAANYNPTDWSSIVADRESFWNTIGNQLTSVNNEKIIISNKQIIEAYKPGDSYAVKPGENTNGIELSDDGRVLKIYVGQHGGWSVHIAYEVTNVQLTFVVSNVATNKGSDEILAYGYSGSFNGWDRYNPLRATILSTNADGTVNIIGTTNNYTGNGKVQYKIRASNSSINDENPEWYWDSGDDKVFIIPITASGGSYTNYYGGPVNF